MSESDNIVRKTNILMTLAVSYWITLVVAIVGALIALFTTR